MDREGTPQEFSKHLIDEINAIGDDVFAELEAEGSTSLIDAEPTPDDPMKELVTELVERIAAPSIGDPHKDAFRQELSASAISILRKMGFPIDDYFPLLHSHGTAVVVNKLIEAKRDGSKPV